MTEEVIEYESKEKSSSAQTETQLEKDSLGGLNWEWNFFTDFSRSTPAGKIQKFVFLKWKFDWDELKKQGVEGFNGTMSFSLNDGRGHIWHSFPVKLLHADQWIVKRMGTLSETKYQEPDARFFQFQFSLMKVHAEDAVNVGIQIPPRFSDSVLVVEGRKINVNKNYLSMRSEFFESLFNSDFKEKSMAEIPIEGVKYEDFQCLLDIIHPTNPTQPTSQTAGILLELADRFMMPAVTNQVENHLLHFSEMPFFQTLLLADKFSLENLLDQCLNQFVSLDVIQILNDRQEQADLSHATKAKLFNFTLPLIKK